MRLFADLDQDEVAQIARLLKERRFPKGETVITRARAGQESYVTESSDPPGATAS